MVTLSLEALERHRHRRSEGVPTVSVLLGDAQVWEWAWRLWQRSQSVPVHCCAEPSVAAALRSWLGARETAASFRRAVLARAAAGLSISLAELEARASARAASQREAFARELGRAAGLEPVLVSVALADNVARELPPAAAEHGARALPAIAGVLGEPPGALFVRSEPSAPSASLAAAAGTLLELAEALPGLELAWIIDEADFASWQRLAAGRDLALLREGVLRIAPELRGGKRQAFTTRAARGQRAARGAMDPQLVVYDVDAFARSRAESELFERLNRRPQTAQLFALNVRLSERFGAAPLEVDLLCESLRIAVEVDGYHHFRDAVAYRRDRGKDVLLQGLGYTVVRVLAADVMEEIDFVLNTIDQVVERQHRSKRA